MDRRSFLTSATAAATLGLATGAGAQQRLKVLIPRMEEDRLAELRAVAPNVDLVVCANGGEALEHAADADGAYGFASAELLRRARRLRWIQVGSAGVEHVVTIPGLAESDIILTNMQGVYAPEIADQALGYLLCFTRSLHRFVGARSWGRPPDVVLEELLGTTMVIIGLGGIGREVARRAHACGMQILATDPKVTRRPDFVAELRAPDALPSLLPRADVVASCVPLTPVTEKLLGAAEFGRMRDGVILLNVSRGRVVDTDALVAALDAGRVAAAGLDVTEPEPLPEGHPLWSRNVIITPHTAGTSPGGFRRAYELFRENLGRFARGQTLLHIVDKQAGY